MEILGVGAVLAFLANKSLNSKKAEIDGGVVEDDANNANNARPSGKPPLGNVRSQGKPPLAPKLKQTSKQPSQQLSKPSQQPSKPSQQRQQQQQQQQYPSKQQSLQPSKYAIPQARRSTPIIPSRRPPPEAPPVFGDDYNNHNNYNNNDAYNDNDDDYNNEKKNDAVWQGRETTEDEIQRLPWDRNLEIELRPLYGRTPPSRPERRPSYRSQFERVPDAKRVDPAALVRPFEQDHLPPIDWRQRNYIVPVMHDDTPLITEMVGRGGHSNLPWARVDPPINRTDKNDPLVFPLAPDRSPFPGQRGDIGIIDLRSQSEPYDNPIAGPDGTASIAQQWTDWSNHVVQPQYRSLQEPDPGAGPNATQTIFPTAKPGLVSKIGAHSVERNIPTNAALFGGDAGAIGGKGDIVAGGTRNDVMQARSGGNSGMTAAGEATATAASQIVLPGVRLLQDTITNLVARIDLSGSLGGGGGGAVAQPGMNVASGQTMSRITDTQHTLNPVLLDGGNAVGNQGKTILSHAQFRPDQTPWSGMTELVDGGAGGNQGKTILSHAQFRPDQTPWTGMSELVDGGAVGNQGSTITSHTQFRPEQNPTSGMTQLVSGGAVGNEGNTILAHTQFRPDQNPSNGMTQLVSGGAVGNQGNTILAHTQFRPDQNPTSGMSHLVNGGAVGQHQSVIGAGGSKTVIDKPMSMMQTMAGDGGAVGHDSSIMGRQGGSNNPHEEGTYRGAVVNEGGAAAQRSLLIPGASAASHALASDEQKYRGAIDGEASAVGARSASVSVGDFLSSMKQMVGSAVLGSGGVVGNTGVNIGGVQRQDPFTSLAPATSIIGAEVVGRQIGFVGAGQSVQDASILAGGSGGGAIGRISQIGEGMVGQAGQFMASSRQMLPETQIAYGAKLQGEAVGVSSGVEASVRRAAVAVDDGTLHHAQLDPGLGAGGYSGQDVHTGGVASHIRSLVAPMGLTEGGAVASAGKSVGGVSNVGGIFPTLPGTSDVLAHMGAGSSGGGGQQIRQPRIGTSDNFPFINTTITGLGDTMSGTAAGPGQLIPVAGAGLDGRSTMIMGTAHGGIDVRGGDGVVAKVAPGFSAFEQQPGHATLSTSNAPQAADWTMAGTHGGQVAPDVAPMIGGGATNLTSGGVGHARTVELAVGQVTQGQEQTMTGHANKDNAMRGQDGVEINNHAREDFEERVANIVAPVEVSNWNLERNNSRSVTKGYGARYRSKETVLEHMGGASNIMTPQIDERAIPSDVGMKPRGAIVQPPPMNVAVAATQTLPSRIIPHHEARLNGDRSDESWRMEPRYARIVASNDPTARILKRMSY